MDIRRGQGGGGGFVDSILEDARERYLKYENYVATLYLTI